ncbi:hypothetical protein R3P38DRAFT_487995 [Favolaschia claudopus]|uniref:Cytochrome P450 n=1 Tax=Favolaschia claudopus TaxID=2862362 RepID=A0AAW0CKM1_9AGAR
MSPRLRAGCGTFECLAKSDIISVHLAGDTVVVLNSLTAATDLLDKRSAIYSDRPPFPMLNDLIGFSWNIGFMCYGPRWKAHRKLFMRQLGPCRVFLPT